MGTCTGGEQQGELGAWEDAIYFRLQRSNLPIPKASRVPEQQLVKNKS